MSAGDTEQDTQAQEPAPRRRAGGGIVGAVRETVLVVAVALVVSLVVKTFLLQAFFIPSQSMEQTLDIGDRVVVSKLTPGRSSCTAGTSWSSPTPAAGCRAPRPRSAAPWGPSSPTP